MTSSEGTGLLKILVIFYFILYGTLQFISGFSDLDLVFYEPPELNISNNIITLFGLIPYILSLFLFIGNILLFSTSNSYVNLFLLLFRTIMFIDILIYAKRVLHPTST